MKSKRPKKNLGLKTSPVLKAFCDKSNPLIKGESPPKHDLGLRTATACFLPKQTDGPVKILYIFFVLFKM